VTLRILQQTFRGVNEVRTADAADVEDAGWSSLVARRAHNPEVAGSNPAPATIIRSDLSPKSP
jgi:hypothetical protein